MKNKVYCAVDIGGTKILLLLIDDQGQVLSKIKAATPEPADPETIIENINVLLEESLQKAALSAGTCPAALGICIAGFSDYSKGLVYQSPNLNWTTPVPLKKLLEDRFACPIFVENDANAAVVGEVFYGAAKGHRDAIYITLSTGIGGGLYLDGRLYRGSTGFAGETGHIKPYGKGRLCKCGGYDCLETWASGSAIARNAVSLWGDNKNDGKTITTSWVFEQAAAGDALAAKIIDYAIDNIGRGLSNLINLLNPSCVVIGGGVAAKRPDFFEQVAKKISSDSIRPSVEITPLIIVGAELEPESGIWGMYALMTG